MRWRLILIRREMLTNGIVLANSTTPIQRTSDNDNDDESPPEIPHPINIPPLPAPPEVLHPVLNSMQNRISRSQVIVYQLGEPIERFTGRKLVELPTPLLASRMADINYFSNSERPQPRMSALIIGYGRRIFVAVKPILHSELFSTHERLILEVNVRTRIGLPTAFLDSLRPDIVEDHRVSSVYLDPTVVLTVEDGIPGDPLVDCADPCWNGFLVIERGDDGPLFVRATAIRLCFPRQPHIQGVQYFPGRIVLSEESRIGIAECLEKLSVPHAQWLGVFVAKDEMGILADYEQLDAIHEKMMNEGICYAIRIAERKGNLYIWSMHIGPQFRGKNNLVFAFVPDEPGIPIQSLSITRAGMAAWRGTMEILGMEIPVKCVLMNVPGRRGIEEFDWGDKLVFLGGWQVRAVLPGLLNNGRWAVRFLADAEAISEESEEGSEGSEEGSEDEAFVEEMQVLTVGFTLIEHGQAFRCRIGEGGENGDLFLIADNVHGLGVCLMGVWIGYGELGV